MGIWVRCLGWSGWKERGGDVEEGRVRGLEPEMEGMSSWKNVGGEKLGKGDLFIADV